MERWISYQDEWKIIFDNASCIGKIDLSSSFSIFSKTNRLRFVRFSNSRTVSTHRLPNSEGYSRIFFSVQFEINARSSREFPRKRSVLFSVSYSCRAYTKRIVCATKADWRSNLYLRNARWRSLSFVLRHGFSSTRGIIRRRLIRARDDESCLWPLWAEPPWSVNPTRQRTCLLYFLHGHAFARTQRE